MPLFRATDLQLIKHLLLQIAFQLLYRKFLLQLMSHIEGCCASLVCVVECPLLVDLSKEILIVRHHGASFTVDLL